MINKKRGQEAHKPDRRHNSALRDRGSRKTERAFRNNLQSEAENVIELLEDRAEQKNNALSEGRRGADKCR